MIMVQMPAHYIQIVDVICHLLTKIYSLDIGQLENTAITLIIVMLTPVINGLIKDVESSTLNQIVMDPQ